jgi:hypothetical protein
MLSAVIAPVLRIVGTFLCFLVLYRFARYLSTPLLRKLGFYRYYSPLFFTMPLFGRTLDIHLGTLWDIQRLGRFNAAVVLLHLSEGLLRLGDDVAAGRIHPDTVLRGSTYFLGAGTLARFGFTSRPPTAGELTLFFLSVLEISLIQSVARRRFVLVPVQNLRIVTCRAEVPLRHRAGLERVAARLRRKAGGASRRSAHPHTAGQRP